MYQKRRLLALFLTMALAGGTVPTALAAEQMQETEQITLDAEDSDQAIALAPDEFQAEEPADDTAAQQSDEITFVDVSGAPEQEEEQAATVDVQSVEKNMQSAEDLGEEYVLPEVAEHTLTGSISVEEISQSKDVQVSTQAVKYNDIVPYTSNSNKRGDSGKKFNLYFTMKRYESAPTSRAVIEIYNPEGKLATEKPATKSFKSGTGTSKLTYTLNTTGGKNKPDAAIGKYTVKCYSQYKKNGKWYRANASKVHTFSFYLTPRLEKLSVTKNSIKLTWAPANYEVKGKSYLPDIYRIYRKKKGDTEWTKVAYLKGSKTVTVNGKKQTQAVTTWEDKTVKAGQRYTYAIRSVYNKQASKRSSSLKYYFVAQMKAPSLSAPAKTKIKVSWKPVSGVSGYQIRFARTKDMKNAKNVVLDHAKTDSVTLTNMTKDVQYYVQIRSFKTASKVKYYGAWSSVVARNK